ncbi:polyribonucleotide nucleotidyltransferase [Wolbachia endosymbiont of Howardula sp.]|uniref:polyribonucleotide nucleotidyltransferase n=1 Tax=Wolbachia endosymbiont of Howardula sp. TaxID=2916816 RepID=UPI00217E9C04|nr:polyribonucleotide nucleotidyltransferase [Wolbachia endosymbiont of Howardula sp.]UWI83308.1 polyribonucleotide nucleotidyltransferase [Wolbachia endosymbiont of Howardula sp.]
MFKIIKKSIEWGNNTLTLETGKIARYADSAIVVSYGNTSILVTIVSKKREETVDFLPLTVQFIAKSYAVGKIPGGFFKREGKPSERETLISRLVDRSIRPLFPEGFYRDISVICHLLTYDSVTPPEVPALIGTMAAIAISGLPVRDVIAGVAVGRNMDRNYILNPSVQELKISDLELFLSGDEHSVYMIESESQELSEEILIDAIKFGHQQIKSITKFIIEFASQVKNKSDHYSTPSILEIDQYVEKYNADFEAAYYSNLNKYERLNMLEEIRNNILNILNNKLKDDKLVKYASRCIERSAIRQLIKRKGMRIDGRQYNEIRQIEIEINTLSSTHGSALFTRGHTQALVITTLGTTQDEQIIDDIEGDRREHFMLHYNFPAFAVGEISTPRAPGRREIGHGKLAWKAINPILPDKSQFPYTIRVVSEILESDGSSSMATVCGTSLALMDTGVPIKAPVSGIAMGLIKDQEGYIILSDILGDEDYLGDMDCKVAGTHTGITVIQMDTKSTGINCEIISQVLEQARDGRLHILTKMNSVISEHSSNIKDHAPKMIVFYIDKEKIASAIGSKGKNIRSICEKSNTKIEIGDDGKVSIFAVSSIAAETAKDLMLISTTDIEQGSIVEAKVIKIDKSIVELELINGRRGKMHISEVANQHIDSIESILKQSDTFKALVIDFEKGGCPKLSRRRVNQETGEFFAGELYNVDRKNHLSDNNDNNYRSRSNRTRANFSSKNNRTKSSSSDNSSSSGFY